MTRYPNLELLEYKTKQLLIQDKSFIATVNAYKKANNETCACFDFATTMFRQNKEYTTILWETLTDTCVVCFGDSPCYKVTKPNEDFINDIAQHSIASLVEAKTRY